MRSGGWLGVSRESRPQPVPSWPTVIATTLRLWLQRHVISARPNRGQQGRYWGLGLTVLAVVVLGAVVVVVSVARNGHTAAAPRPAGRQARTAVDPAPASSAHA